MTNWHPDKVRKLRGEILKLLCGNHNMQKSRMDDVLITRLLQGMAFDVEIADIVTVLQYMAQRDWVKFRQVRNPLTQRTELSQIEVLPDGRDIVEQTTMNSAVLLW
jgi:hypothetical protein